MIKDIKKYLLENKQNFSAKSIELDVVVDENDFFTLDFIDKNYMYRLAVHENDYLDFEKIDKNNGQSLDCKSYFFEDNIQQEAYINIVKEIVLNLLS